MPALAFTPDELAALAASVAAALAPTLGVLSRPAQNLTISQAAGRLGVSPDTVRTLIAAGDLVANRIGTKPLISETEIARFIAGGEERERERLEQMRRQAAITALTRRRRGAAGG